MGKVCEACGQTRWEGRQVEGYVDSLREERDRYRRALEDVASARYSSDTRDISAAFDRAATALHWEQQSNEGET